MATEQLLIDFPAISTAEWEAAIARDLKGADFEKRLIWHAEEGITVKPYYRAEDLTNLAAFDQRPGEFPYRRSARATAGWEIREVVEANDPESANRAARAAVAGGAEAISYCGLLMQNPDELGVSIANLQEIPIHFENANEKLVRLLLESLIERPLIVRISTGFDPLANLQFAENIVRAAPLGFVPFSLHADAFEEAGATTVQEIGFALAAGAEFLAAMTESGIDVEHAAEAIEFSFAVGSNYFFQIAKLRAFRLLWSRVAESFDASSDGSRARIAARTSRWNKTVYDPYVNILRATTEAMAAVLGGADAVTVASFDDCFKKPDEASRRLARNTQLLLKHEASLGRVADPGGGSYFIEALTESLACASWNTMQQIEARGGFLKARQDGFIAGALERSSAAREAAVANRRRVLIGTNQFANSNEQAIDRVDEGRMSAVRRAASAYEKLRLRCERRVADGSKNPCVLLAEIGDMKMRAARSNFALNFFACAGFQIETKRFKKAAEIAETAADLLVLCSSDAEYAAFTASLMQRLRKLGRTTPVIIAGNPEDAEQLKAAGVADFVHVRSNPLEVLTRWQGRLGIRD